MLNIMVEGEVENKDILLRGERVGKIVVRGIWDGYYEAGFQFRKVGKWK